MVFIQKFEKKDELEEKDSKLIVSELLRREELIKCFHSGFHKYKICCITENENLQREFKPYFEDIFGIYAPKITVTSQENYDENIKDTIQDPKSKNVFIFNPDLNSIIHQTFKKKFSPDKFKLEVSVIRSTDIKKSINSVFEVAKDIINDISTRKIRNKKDMKNRIESNKGDLIYDMKDMEHILKSQFEFKPVFYNEKILKNSGYSNW